MLIEAALFNEITELGEIVCIILVLLGSNLYRVGAPDRRSPVRATCTGECVSTHNFHAEVTTSEKTIMP
jgi:hypothetical protein